MESSPRIHLPLMDWQDPAALSGELMRMPDIGPATARLPWETFGSLEAMRAASVDDLRRLPDIGAARAALLHEKLKGLES